MTSISDWWCRYCSVSSCGSGTHTDRHTNTEQITSQFLKFWGLCTLLSPQNTWWRTRQYQCGTIWFICHTVWFALWYSLVYFSYCNPDTLSRDGPVLWFKFQQAIPSMLSRLEPMCQEEEVLEGEGPKKRKLTGRNFFWNTGRCKLSYWLPLLLLLMLLLMWMLLTPLTSLLTSLPTSRCWWASWFSLS